MQRSLEVGRPDIDSFEAVMTRENRDLLLPKLVSGEVDVSELDIAMRAAGTY